MIAGLSLLTGFAAGFLGCLVGIGGGVIMVPMLTHVMGLEQPKAHATSLTAVFFTGFVGTLSYGHYGYLDWGLILPLVVASVMGGYMGAKSLKRVEKEKLRRYFGVFLIVVALLMILKSISFLNKASAVALPKLFSSLLLGLAVGFISGILGVGGGTLMVPLLVLLLNVPQHLAQGASLTVMVPTAFVGSLVHLREGRVELKVAPFLWISIVLGGFIGSYVAHLFPGRELRFLFSIVIFALGVLYILRRK